MQERIKMMQEVYVVTLTHYEETSVERVYGNEQDAIDFCKIKNSKSGYDFWDYQKEKIR